MDSHRFDKVTRALAFAPRSRRSALPAIALIGIGLRSDVVAENKKNKEKKEKKFVNELMELLNQYANTTDMLCGQSFLDCSSLGVPGKKKIARRVTTVVSLSEAMVLLPKLGQAYEDVYQASQTHGPRSAETCQAVGRLHVVGEDIRQIALALAPYLAPFVPPLLSSQSTCGTSLCCANGDQCINGSCEDDSTCHALGQSCSQNGECCGNDNLSSVCGNTQCATSICCRRDFQTCSRDCDCCTVAGTTMSCQGGTCKPVQQVCAGLEEACSSSQGCCGGAACDTDVCQTGSVCCLPPGRQCARHCECCDPNGVIYLCVNGTCQLENPTCLPVETNCSGVCTDLNWDSTNCNACGNACGANCTYDPAHGINGCTNGMTCNYGSCVQQSARTAAAWAEASVERSEALVALKRGRDGTSKRRKKRQRRHRSK